MDDAFPCNCFTAGTLVKTNEGEKPVEQIKEYDLVWAENPETGEKELKRVVATYVFPNKRNIYHLFIGKDTIRATDNHPFWLKEGWIEAKELRVGDSLKLLSGNWVSLDSIYLEEGIFETYNFTVEDFHTYFVGKEGILVHNCAKFDKWNLGEAVVTKRHHNWDKIFGNQQISLQDVTPYVQEALKKGEWESIKTLRNNAGEVIGEGLILRSNVDGHTIWVEGTKLNDGKIIVKNAGVD